MQKRLVQIAVLVAGAFVFLIPASAQFGGLGDVIRDRAEREAREAAERGLARALFPLEAEGAHIRRQAPQLDRIDFGSESDMSTLARTPAGGFVLKPGYWTFRAQAFCLKAGTYERPGGRGYFSGVLVGKVAPYVQAIRAGAYAHPEVAQRNIQELLWGLVAGLDLNDMTDGARAAAGVLLSPEQYGALVDLGWVPPQLSAQVIARLPPAVQTALNARDRLRTIAGQPGTTYADLERIAVLPGDPPRSDEDDDVPVGRWSWHPIGFHIRYSTTSYRWVDVEIIVGERLAIAHDSLGRIVEISLPDGAYIRASYRDDVEPYTWSEVPGRAAYAFASVEIGSPDPDGGPMRIARSEDQGFAWGSDGRRRQAEAAPRRPRSALDAGILLATAGARDRFPAIGRYAAYSPGGSLGLAVTPMRSPQIPVIDVEEARARVEEARERQEYFQARIDAATRPVTDEDLEAMLDLDHYYEGAKTVVGDSEERVEWIIETHERVTRAIARATERLGELGEDGEADDGAAPDDEGGTDEPAWEPHEDTAMPASSLSQMLGMVGRLFE